MARTIGEKKDILPPVRGWYIAVSNILLLIASLIFASGFFPYKPLLAGIAKHDEARYGKMPVAPFDKVVLMVVDALRSDFVYSHNSGFDFTQSLIRSGSAIPFTAHATAPTVTMPRIKAITTGSIPSFLDMILNFAESDTTSSLANQDTWLAQMKAKGNGILTMFGDDTWLKLFPGTFERFDGTSSFFVSDFTEVDNNVTRHVPEELEKTDWSVMILHYLGMDHIGHKTGPRSTNMLPKQREMDNIIRTIITAFDGNAHLSSTLLILCGDHGMNDGGNHGGSAPGETSPALLFMSPKFQTMSGGQPCPTQAKEDFEYYDMVEQSDIAPTLAALLGFPTPLNNLGVLIPAFLEMWSSASDRVRLLLYNARQMLEIVKNTFPHPWYDNQSSELECSIASSPRDILACAWKQAMFSLNSSNQSTQNSEAAITALFAFCRLAQDEMSSTASNYNIPRLYAGVILAAIATVLSILAAVPQVSRKNWSTWLSLGGLLIGYALLMFASSYVEEEHNFWYWIASGWLVVLYASSQTKALTPPYSHIALLTLLRISRRWQQSGQKHTGASSISRNLKGPFAPFLCLVVLITLLDLGGEISRTTLQKSGVPKAGAGAIGAMLITATVIFKIAFTFNDEPELLKWLGFEESVSWCKEVDLVLAARLVFGGLLACLCYVVFAKITFRDRRAGGAKKVLLIHTLQPLLTILLITQTRIRNIPLFLLFSLQLRLLRHLSSYPSIRTPLSRPTTLLSPPTTPLSIPSLSLTTLIFSHVSFFCMGNTNAISSLDLSNAYNGISSYNAGLVGFLLFLGNWAGPIWWLWSGLGLVIAIATQQPPPPPMSTVAGKMQREQESSPGNLAAQRRRNKLVSQTQAVCASAYTSYLSISTLFFSIAATATLVACTVLRTHLFVWTVFSPKFLYAVAWLGLWHGIVGVAVLGGIVWVETWL